MAPFQGEDEGSNPSGATRDWKAELDRVHERHLSTERGRRDSAPKLPWTPTGVCRMCGGQVLKKDGTQDRRRTWHRGEAWEERNCVQDYNLHFQSRVRLYVWERDKGVCKICGRREDLWGGWEADHVVPLADGGSYGMENLQTLCTEHHREKTARENAVRASTRKRDPRATTS